MMTYFNSLISLRLPQSNGINETLSNFFLTHNEHNMEVIFPVKVFHFLHYYFAYAQYIYNFFISLNRFSLITNPIKSELFWRKRFWWFVFAIFAIPWAFAVPILVGRSYYVYHSHGDYFFLDTTIVSYLHGVPIFENLMCLEYNFIVETLADLYHFGTNAVRDNCNE